MSQEIYKGICKTTEVPLLQLDSTVSPTYKTEVILPQLDSITRRTPSKSPSKSPSTSPEPVTPGIELNNCTVEDITVPKGKHSNFLLTLRDSEGQVLRGCVSYIKVTVMAIGKGIYEAVRIEEQPNGSYLVSYTPKSTGTSYQVICYV